MAINPMNQPTISTDSERMPKCTGKPGSGVSIGAQGVENSQAGDVEVLALAKFHGFNDSYDDMNFTPPLLSTIQARTFVGHGNRDQFVPVSIPVQMYRNIPKSYLWIVPIGGHVPIYGDNEEMSVTNATEFLAGNGEKNKKNNQPR